jgi:hypothetical protein
MPPADSGAAASGAGGSDPGGRAAPPAHAGADRGPAERPRAGAQAVALGARTNAAYGGTPRAEGALAQPVVMAHAPVWRGRVRLTATLNFEGLTLSGGQLNPGIYGEGFVDRRHPHTFAHELVASAGGRVPGLPGVDASLSAGKGFVAFGTDDPMMRPFALFPVNHHLAQILERYVATAGVRARRAALGEAALEATLFGGDEPAGPVAVAARRPLRRRVGRARDRPAAARRAGRPRPARALGERRARAVAGEPGRRRPRPAQVERRRALGRGRPRGGRGARRARRRELRPRRVGAHRRAPRPPPRLPLRERAGRGRRAPARRRAGGAVGAHHAPRGGARGRPVPHRAPAQRVQHPRPHRVAHRDGVARRPVRAGALRALPFVELARAVPRDVLRPSAFEPRAFYGAATLWTAVVGARVGLGTPHARMGRYGVAADHGAHGAPPAARHPGGHAGGHPGGR